MKLVYSQDAIADLVRLRHFIAQHDPTAAARVAADLVIRVEALLVFPAMGRAVPQSPTPESVRDLVLGKYVVRYALLGSVLVVLRVWHHFETTPGVESSMDALDSSD